ncbi:hypothetical protein Pmani_030161 [Petrolisthes manimaculis]|uniref:Uncharacterized protein n=1 Tax=Petrolisthes manimaculis TaxID=1843537 RepID=A0AAE1NY29_9EUCA|nr:hypothetical protein Pmani_030161 [Petrolisthes manimaculis]
MDTETQHYSSSTRTAQHRTAPPASTLTTTTAAAAATRAAGGAEAGEGGWGQRRNSEADTFICAGREHPQKTPLAAVNTSRGNAGCDILRLRHPGPPPQALLQGWLPSSSSSSSCSWGKPPYSMKTLGGGDGDVGGSECTEVRGKLGGVYRS